MNWKLLKIKAIAEDYDPLNREFGQPLWEERYDIKALNDIKSMLGNRIFSAMYQQEPNSKESQRFNLNNIKYFHNEEQEIINNCKVTDNAMFIIVDPAFTDNKNSDFTAIAVCGKNSNEDLFVYEIIRMKILAGEHEKFLIDLASQYNIRQFGVEVFGGQSFIADQLKSHNFDVQEFVAKQNKIERASKLGSLFYNGKVYFKSKSNWINDLIIELDEFPRGRYDDQVDVMAYAALFDINFSYNGILSTTIKKDKIPKGRYNKFGT